MGMGPYSRHLWLRQSCLEPAHSEKLRKALFADIVGSLEMLGWEGGGCSPWEAETGRVGWVGRADEGR